MPDLKPTKRPEGGYADYDRYGADRDRTEQTGAEFLISTRTRRQIMKLAQHLFDLRSELAVIGRKIMHYDSRSRQSTVSSRGALLGAFREHGGQAPDV